MGRGIGQLAAMSRRLVKTLACAVGTSGVVGAQQLELLPVAPARFDRGGLGAVVVSGQWLVVSG